MSGSQMSGLGGLVGGVGVSVVVVVAGLVVVDEVGVSGLLFWAAVVSAA